MSSPFRINNTSTCSAGLTRPQGGRKVVMTPAIDTQIKVGTVILVALVCVASGAAMAVACIGASRARKAKLAALVKADPSIKADHQTHSIVDAQALEQQVKQVQGEGETA